MKEIIEINSVQLNGELSILTINSQIETLENAVIKELEKDEYNSIVTMDNFKVMKESSQFLGKVAKQISDFRIAKVKEEMQDIKLFEDSLKRFTKMFQDKQNNIKSGLDIFEEETRKKVRNICKEYFSEFCDKVELRQEFRNIALDDMTLTKYATATFKISKAGIDEVEKRVNIQLTLQTKVDNRLLNLENECLKANIEPLTQQHIQGFLYSSDEEYQIKLRNLIVAEIERNEAIKKREQEKAEKELREKLEAENKAKEVIEREEVTPFDEPVEKEDLDLEEVTREIDGQKIVIAYMCTDDKTDYIYNLKRELVSTVYNNDYKVVQVLDRLEKEVIGLKQEEVKTVLENGNVRKFVTVTFEVVVPKSWEDKVQSTYEKRFVDNIKNVENMKVVVQ